jgi:hypothetical protein
MTRSESCNQTSNLFSKQKKISKKIIFFLKLYETAQRGVTFVWQANKTKTIVRKTIGSKTIGQRKEIGNKKVSKKLSEYPNDIKIKIAEPYLYHFFKPNC